MVLNKMVKMLYKQLVHEILRVLNLEVGIDVDENKVPELCQMIQKRTKARDLLFDYEDYLQEKYGDSLVSSSIDEYLEQRGENENNKNI